MNLHLCVSEAGSADSQSLKLMAMIDSVGRYYQIGCSESRCNMYTLSVTIDTASGLLQVVTFAEFDFCLDFNVTVALFVLIL